MLTPECELAALGEVNVGGGGGIDWEAPFCVGAAAR